MITVKHRKAIEAIARAAIKKLTGDDISVSLIGYRNIEFCNFENATAFPFGQFQVAAGGESYIIEISISGVKSLYPGSLEWI